MAASCACGVPATEGSTAPASECGGMLLEIRRAARRSETNFHGPDNDIDVNHRPASST